MDEFKSLTPNSSVVKISACMDKIYKKICESCEKKIAEYNIKEIEFLKTQCKSDNILVSLMSGQTLVRLVESNVLDATNVVALLVALLPSCSASHSNTIAEAVFGILRLDIKRKSSALNDNQQFINQYGMKSHQHPLITLLQCPTLNMHNIASKMSSICRHHDPHVRNNSIEYLRPVYLYILCNPQILPESKAIWTDLLALSNKNTSAKFLVKEILAWSRFSTAPTCLFTSVLLIDAIDYYLERKDLNAATELSIFQALLVNHLAKFGLDPGPTLNSLLNILHTTREHTNDHYNVLLVLLSESVHRLCPAYLPDLFRVLAFIIVQKNCGHQYILNMCLDGIIQWMSQTAFIPSVGLTLAHQIIKRILEKSEEIEKVSLTDIRKFPSTEVRYYHPDIAIAYNISKLVESFDESEFKDVFAFVDALNIKSNSTFCQHMHLFLRALFLSKEPAVDCWFKIYKVILELIKINNNIAYDFLMTYIFKLASEKNPEIQLELLRGLPTFGMSKDNIPMILNVIRNLSNDNTTFCMDLYLRLWRVEVRTYPFLIKLIAQPPKNSAKQWEYYLAKAHIIHEICVEKPNNYGAELVSQLSEILNAATDESGDSATALALDAIVVLCESNTINIISTWNVLSQKFWNEKRPRALKALINYFAKIPHLHTQTIEYDFLVDEALTHLWSYITDPSFSAEIVKDAIAALKDYEPGTLLTVRSIPPQFRQGISNVQEYTKANGREIVDLQSDVVPGECWVQLLQKIRPDCGAAVADLISHYIAAEISEFRSGVYRIPEGKPEPRKLQGLFVKSPLRAVVNYLVSQARLADNITEPHAVTNALRAICKKFSKPIPPLDWCFLHSFFHISFEARKYCILIAKNQLLHSGTANRLLENFLVEFEPNCFEEDLLLLFSIMPDIARGVNLTILKNFVEKVVIYCFKESQLNGFTEGCLFENFLDSAKLVFTSEYDMPEVVDLFTLVIERYMDSMDLESRVFERYTEVVSLLSTASIDGLTSPATWWEVPIGKLKKATIIRCYLVLYNDQLPNPLTWLAPITDAYCSRPDVQNFYFRHLTATLYAFNNDQNACNWLLEMFMKISTLLGDQLHQEMEKIIYLIDIFILAVVVLSGCAILQGNLDVVASDRAERFEMFPESVQLLCQHVFWKDQQSRIYEFIYNLYKNPLIPDEYVKMFRYVFICSHNESYFDHKLNWTKYVGMRK